MSKNNTPANTGSLNVRVMNGRLGRGSAKLFFNVAIGADGNFGLVIRDLVLRTSPRNGNDYPAYPSKPRTRKAVALVDGRNQDVYVPVVQDGKPVWDAIVDFYFEGEGDSRKATDFSWEVQRAITEQATALYEKLSRGNAGGERPVMDAPAGVASSTGAARSTSPFGPPAGGLDEGDDDLPF